MFEGLKDKARKLKTEIYAIYIAYTRHKIPWYAKLLAVTVLAYALSPIDLIPDFIPVLGYLDDLVLLPLGIALIIKLIPPDVMGQCRAQARAMGEKKLPRNYVMAAVIILLWAGIAALIIYKAVGAFK